MLDERNAKLATGTAPVDAAGGFDARFAIAAGANLGGAEVVLTPRGWPGEGTRHPFQIQEFRTPEFEVTARASQGPFVVGGSADVTVDAKYYAGGALGGAPVGWSVTATPTSFMPPNRDDYVFGKWTPWWGALDDEADVSPYAPPQMWTLTGTTDARARTSRTSTSAACRRRCRCSSARARR